MKPINSRITCPFGKRGPLWKDGIHKGVDFAAKVGTPVYAAVSGTVVHAGKHIPFRGWGPAFGIHVIVDNDRFKNGAPGRWAGYMHLSKVAVKKGQRVKQGQLIGWSGATGNVTGPHLHFEVQIGRRWGRNNYVNPQKWIDA